MALRRWSPTRWRVALVDGLARWLWRPGLVRAAFRLGIVKRVATATGAPIFVVGCGHTGTTLMLRMLDEHPDVSAAQTETAMFLYYPRRAYRMAATWVRNAERSGQRPAEKTPRHIRHIDRIVRLIPNAQFVVMVRDPRDVACSMKARRPEGGFELGLQRWIEDYTALVDATERLRVGDDQVSIVRLEDLVSDPSATLYRVLRFLELPPADLLSYHERPVTWYSDRVIVDVPDESLGSHHAELRNWQINQPLFESTTRWPHEMTDEERQTLEACRPLPALCRRLGYTEPFGGEAG